MMSAHDADPLAYAFDADHGQHAAQLGALLGAKGTGLALMTAMGLPVPPGFTMTTAACRAYRARGWSDDHERAVLAGLAELEARTGRRLGDPRSPLVVSVRGGAELSMPGMLTTVLDVGITDEVAGALGREAGSADFGADTHRRARASFAAACDAELPASPVEQVQRAVRAVFDSWWSDRAVRYRSVEGIDDRCATAATVQVMVFGNLDEHSGTGVAFSRDPTSGRPGLMGDFLPGAQGEDVVAGDHHVLPLDDMRIRWPHTWAELAGMAERLEQEFQDMVDIEFTVERGRLWLLQARRGKRSPLAAVQIAVDLASDPEFPIDRAEAVRRCSVHLHDPPTVDATAGGDEVVVAEGHAAAPGRAVGLLCVDVDRATELRAEGHDVILVRRQTSPADIHGMAASAGLVTTTGGPVSHAAVVARSWGLPAVVGISALAVLDRAVEAGGIRIEEGETVTVDGDAGRLLLGAHAGHRTVAPAAEVLRRWAAEIGADPPGSG